MTQKLPLPLTPAMLARANENEAKPRYTGAGAASDWHGGEYGNDIDHAEATQAIANSGSADVETDYDPQHQTAKAEDMVPPRTIVTDIGQDYGVYAGDTGRAGNIAPRQPYPATHP